MKMANLAFLTCLFFMGEFSFSFAKPETQFRSTCQPIKGVVPNENCMYIIDDMVMTEEQLLEAYGLVAMNGQTNPAKLWPNGEIPITFDSDISSAEQTFLWEVATRFNSDMNGCLSMIPLNGHTNYVKVIKDGGCWSQIGMVGGGEQELSLVGNLGGGGCWFEDTVVHEFIHAFGFHHEQVRPDRDNYVEIVYENIPEDKVHNFNLFTGSRTFGVQYDGYSVMHYSSTAFSNYSFGNGNTIESKRTDLWTSAQLGSGSWMSQGDMTKLRQMYQCDGLNCGGVISGGGDGTITSPEWGSSATYPSFQNCTWIIYCDGQIVLNVKNFELESHSTCSWDSVSISDGTTTDKFCGTTIPTSFTSNTGFGNVTFISDSMENFAGFEFDYFCNSSMTTKLPSTKTTTTMTTTTTTNTTSGECNDNWMGDGFCDDVNNKPGCDYDGGDCCGPSVNTTYCTECMCKECGGEVSGPSGTLQSPNWPEMYPANTSCLWIINCEDGGKPNVSVHWGDMVNNVVWSENAGCSDQTPQIAVMTEPFCPPPIMSFDTLRGMLRMDALNPASMIIGSDGNVGFESNPYSIGGKGFEIKYQCPVKEPCEDIKSAKFCKKQKKKGKCKKASIWKKCKLTCDKCD